MVIRLARSFKGVHVPKVIFYMRAHDGVRGSASDVILPEDSVRRQFIYDQKIFSWVKQEFHIHEFTPTFALKWDQALAERAALLERACVFAAHAMWDDAIDNFRQAGQSSAIPAKPEELKLAERVIKDENASGDSSSRIQIGAQSSEAATSQTNIVGKFSKLYVDLLSDAYKSFLSLEVFTKG
jgi:hypothetical protein